MTKIYSYVVRSDTGAAPNPFWGICTLTICKPIIRKNASIGDWIIGTGSKNAKCNDGNIHDLACCLVYAMRVSDVKTLRDYDTFCKTSLANKIPKWRTSDWRLRMGDCIYDFSSGSDPILRRSVHDENERKRDLDGVNALLSEDFYYFGEAAKPIPEDLQPIIKRYSGHKIIVDTDIISRFEHWIESFEKNRIYADPQLRFKFDRHVSDAIASKCSN